MVKVRSVLGMLKLKIELMNKCNTFVVVLYMEVVLNMPKVCADGADVCKWRRCTLLFVVLMLVVVEMVKCHPGRVVDVVVASCGVEDECPYYCSCCGACVSGRIDDEGLPWCWGLYLSSDIDDHVTSWCWFC